jgi:hypothetical protein
VVKNRIRVVLRLVTLAVTALAGLPAAASADVKAFDLIPCKAQSDGTRFCEGGTSLFVHSFDGQPLDVNVSLPAPASGHDGPYPLILVLHGYGGTKKDYDTRENPFLPSAHELTKRGYAVINTTDRGFGDSCGSPSSRLMDPACATGWLHLLDTRYEIHDFQFLAGKLVDQGLASPTKIGAIGESYGGGSSMMLAALKDRTMNPDGSLVPWRSPKGTPMSLAAATPTIPWSDLVASLVPNGHTLDYAITGPTDGLNPVGVMKQSFISGLYALGQTTGYYSPPGADPDSDLTTWVAQTSAGEPYDRPDIAATVDKFVKYRSPFYVLDGVVGGAPHEPAPMLLSSGFTDDLFPAQETLRVYNLERRLFPKLPLELVYMDYGHMRGTNKDADMTLLRDRIVAWIDHYVKGGTPDPGQNVVVLTQTCPKSAPSGGPFVTPTWAAQHPGEIDFTGSGTQTITSAGGDPNVAKAIDPVGGGGDACAKVDAADEPGTANYRLPAAIAAGYTMVGAPTLTAKIAITGTFPEVAARLWDVGPDGQQTLVDRTIYRPAGDGTAIFQLNPNAWLFAAGHVPKLQLLGRDAPYARASNGTFSIDVSALTLSVPTRETSGNGIVAAKDQPLPAGAVRAPVVAGAKAPKKHKPKRHHHAKKHKHRRRHHRHA